MGTTSSSTAKTQQTVSQVAGAVSQAAATDTSSNSSDDVGIQISDIATTSATKDGEGAASAETMEQVRAAQEAASDASKTLAATKFSRSTAGTATQNIADLVARSSQRFTTTTKAGRNTSAEAASHAQMGAQPVLVDLRGGCMYQRPLAQHELAQHEQYSDSRFYYSNEMSGALRTKNPDAWPHEVP